MKMRKYAVVAALATAALGVAGTTANAAPAPAPAPAPVVEAAAPAPVADPVSGFITDAAVFVNTAAQQVIAPNAAAAPAELTTPLGTVTLDKGQFSATASTGQTVISAPVLPAAAPAPVVFNPMPTEVAAPVATPVAASRFKTWEEREQWEFNRMKDSISIGATIGTFTGAVIGGTIGCVSGGFLAGAVTGPLAPLGALGGCAAGAAAMGSLGALTGIVLVGIPVAVGAGINYLAQTQSPFEAPKTK